MFIKTIRLLTLIPLLFSISAQASEIVIAAKGGTFESCSITQAKTYSGDFTFTLSTIEKYSHPEWSTKIGFLFRNDAGNELYNIAYTDSPFASDIKKFVAVQAFNFTKETKSELSPTTYHFARNILPSFKWDEDQPHQIRIVWDQSNVFITLKTAMSEKFDSLIIELSEPPSLFEIIVSGGKFKIEVNAEVLNSCAEFVQNSK
ncbi:MAG: hypothetical protein HY253_02355 [Burkholderiales bacterium]|nr:hypothetical protein [Burkholderiales bacterium]